MQTKRQNSGAFTLIEIMIITGLIGVLAILAIPNFVKSRTITQQTICLNNLHKIEDAKQEWAVETKQSPDADAEANAEAVNVYLKTEKTPTCPAGGTYDYQKVNMSAICTTHTDLEKGL